MADFTVADYLARSGASESSLSTYRKLLTRCEALLGKPLGAATERDLDTLKAALRKKLSGPGYVAELRRFYRAAGLSDLAAICVLKQRKRRLSPDEILTLPEVNVLMAAANSLRDRALIATLWATGQRVTAVTSLRLGDLKEKPSANGGGAIRIFFREVKVAGEENVSWVLDQEGADHIRSWLRAYPFGRTEDAPVFPSYTNGRGNPLNESAVLKVLHATAKRAGMTKRVYPHLFRHSRATHLKRLGVPDAQIEMQMGWAPGSGMLQRRYGHLVHQDSYVALLKAHGLPAPTAEDLGKLVAAEGELKPVVPMAAAIPRKADVESPEAMAEKARKMEALLLEPDVQRVIRLLRDAM